MIKYEVIIYWSEEDQAFIAEVPELPGCLATAPRIGKPWPTWKSLFRNGWKPRRNWAAPFLNPGAG